MLHLRIIAPGTSVPAVVGLLTADPSVTDVVVLPGVCVEPEGDLVMCDVAREAANEVLEGLRALGVDQAGSVSVTTVETTMSRAVDAAEAASPGLAADAVVWEEIEDRTSEEAALSVTFLAFLVIAALIAAVGILVDSPILIVGAMVVGPEFGPLAGLAVAIVQRRPGEARTSLLALAVGLPCAAAAAWAGTLALRAAGLAPDGFATVERPLTEFISRPDALSFVVAVLAGAAGMLSLTSAKSGALVGVLISVTTIPAAANIGVAAAYADWGDSAGAAGQLALNMAGVVVAGVATLELQRRRRGVTRREATATRPGRTPRAPAPGSSASSPPAPGR